MTSRSIFLLLILLVTQRESILALYSNGKIVSDVVIFYNASSRYMRNIVQRAESLFLANRPRSKISLEQEASEVYVNPLPIDSNKIALSQVGASGGSLSQIWNISSQTLGAIFVDVNVDALYTSSLLEELDFPTIGIFQSEGQPRTQESPADFTRVALPSVKYYAQIIWELMKKTERRSLCLVLSVDSDGQELADSMTQVAEKEKWFINKIFWLVENNVPSIKNISASLPFLQSDVVVVHSRNEDNGVLLGMLTENNTSHSLWVVTDVTMFGLSNVNILPDGLIRINARSENIDSTFYSDAIYDALLLYQAALQKALGMDLHRITENVCYEYSGDIGSLIYRNVKDSYLEGLSSLFVEPSLHKKSTTSFEIWNLRGDKNGAKCWTLVGLSTPSGFALDTVRIPNGSTITPPAVPMTHVVRVPVNEYSPWVQIEDSRIDGRGSYYCIGRGQLCYKYHNGSRIKKSTLCCLGVSIDLLVMMQNELGFQSEIYFTPDGNYGDFDENKGMWNGIVQEVVSGQADFAIDISVNSIRAKYLDFAQPFVHVALNILVLKDLRVNDEIQWSSWLEPFQYELWFFILGFINIILLVTWWIDRKSPYGHYRQVDSGDDGFTLLDSMTYVWGVAFGKDIGAEKTPHSSSARCVSTFFALFALIVVNTYCANLMAFLVQEEFVLPISGIRDEKIRHPSLMPPNGFKLGVQENSQEESYFKFHSEDMFREIYQVNLQVNFVRNFADGLEKLKNREIHGLVGDHLSLSQVANNDIDCSYSLAGPNFFNFGLGIALPKASPWLQDINQAVLKHQENGAIETIERRWFNKKTCDLKPFKQLEIINLSGLFMTVVIVIAFCVLVIFLEFGVVIAIMKFGDRLGAIGKFTKNFVLNVKEGEEAHLKMQYSFIFRRHRKESWDIAAANARVERITGVELGFHNNEYCFSQEQPLGHVNSDMNGNGHITTNRVSQMNTHAHVNGHMSHSRTRKLKETEMMTKL